MSSRNWWQWLLETAFPRRASQHPNLVSFFTAIRKKKHDLKGFLTWGIPFVVLLLGLVVAYLIFPKNLLGYIAMVGTALLSSILLWLGTSVFTNRRRAHPKRTPKKGNTTGRTL